MWLLPTKNRLADLRRFLSAAREMATSTPGLIVVNRSDWDVNRDAYQGLRLLLPREWDFAVVEAESYGEAIRAVWPRVAGAKWVGLVADDLVPATSAWDVQLVRRLNGWNFVSANDAVQAPNRMHGATVWSMPLLEAVGWLFPPELRHVFHDDIWENIGRAAQCWETRMEVVTRHLHEFYATGARGPTMDPESVLWKHDQAVFEVWMRDELPQAVARVNELKAKFGICQINADLTGVKVMLASPSMSGEYESTFTIGMFNTFGLLAQHGAGYQWASEHYTADIALARNKLLAAFLRSQCTHLLLIDADMGWEPGAVVRLFAARKDFVAIAGPKKRYPLTFAANHTDDAGNPILMTMDPQSGTMEVSEVGLAFALLTRACVERMAAAYPELAYDGVTGDPEWGLCIPFIRGRRYYSEDFAFCRRWRDLGGTVHIVPDVSLKHTGKHTFEGAFIQHAAVAPSAPQFEEAAE